MSEPFYPNGSESICYWCTEINKCACWAIDYKMKSVWNGVNVEYLFKDFYSKGQIRSCPINFFSPNTSYIERSIIRNNKKEGE